MEIQEAFGITLKRYRQELAMSQEELANECGLDRTFISLLERGKRTPTLTTIFKISSYLKIKPSALVQEIENLVK